MGVDYSRSADNVSEYPVWFLFATEFKYTAPVPGLVLTITVHQFSEQTL